MKPLLPLAVGLAAGFLNDVPTQATVFGQDAGYPGPLPGLARVVCQSNVIAVSNAALSMTWSVQPDGLKLRSARNEATGQSLILTGELFQIVLTNGHRYNASSLVPENPPQASALRPDRDAARVAAHLPGRQIELPLRSADGFLCVLWRAIILDNANYVRQEIVLSVAQKDTCIGEIAWLGEPLPGVRAAGTVDGSPLVTDGFFFGMEDPHAWNRVEGPLEEVGAWAPEDFDYGKRRRKVLSRGSEGPVWCRLRRDAPLRKDETLTQSLVWGVAPAGQMRRAFLYYLERERAHPYRPFLHYNSWYDIAWPGSKMDETNCLEVIRVFGEKFIKPHGVVLDAFVFDDGWDNPKTLWQFHDGFPRGFKPHAALAREYGSGIGVWLSPFGGYGEARAERLKYGQAQGYEINDRGFSMAGPKYYAAFKRSCVDMIGKFGANHFKFDGIASGMYANGPGPGHLLDTEAMRRLMLELRQDDPNLYINLTTGSWPSPFWLRFADSVWRQGDDMGFAGPGNKQQQWLTYRDQEVRKNIVGKGPLYPLNSLMTQGVAWSRHGHAANPEFSSAGFKDDVRAFFGSGTGLQELYIQPQRLSPEDWRVLAEAAQWSRTNADVLVDTHWIGGDPARLEVYGYASWTPRKGIIMLRNPGNEMRDFALDVGAAFQLPPGVPAQFKLKSPWTENAREPGLTLVAGTPLWFSLEPFQIIILDALPAD